jgi:hypothetical protein
MHEFQYDATFTIHNSECAACVQVQGHNLLGNPPETCAFVGPSITFSNAGLQIQPIRLHETIDWNVHLPAHHLLLAEDNTKADWKWGALATCQWCWRSRMFRSMGPYITAWHSHCYSHCYGGPSSCPDDSNRTVTGRPDPLQLLYVVCMHRLICQHGDSPITSL